MLPVLDGPLAAARPVAAADDRQGHARAGVGRASSRRRSGGSRTTRSGTRRAASPAHGSNYEAPFGARVEERYEGTTGVSKDDPALAWARGRTVYRITWPEADVRTEATLDLRSDAEAYHVVITLIAEELGARARRDGVLPRAAVRAVVPAAACLSTPRERLKPSPGAF